MSLEQNSEQPIAAVPPPTSPVLPPPPAPSAAQIKEREQTALEPSVWEAPSQAKQPSATGGLITREILETIFLTLLIFWVVNTLTGRFKIEGSSMMPTMQDGEYVLINKLAYWLQEPERGDVIVLHYPRDPSRDFIKRVIALPGDTVRVENQEVYINDVLLDEPYINAAPNYGGNWTVAEDHVFVFGDNRNNSQDSHSFGGVKMDLIVGRGWAIYWPFNQIELVPHNPHPDVPDATQ